MITAASQLAAYGVPLTVAREWLWAHLGDPASIFVAAKHYGVTNGMLAEVSGEGISAQQVVGFFNFHGIDSTTLDGGEPRLDLFPKQLDAVPGLLSMNTATGMLATGSLRSHVQGLTGELAYWELFSPNRLEIAFDGVLSPDELGIDALGPLAATPQALESLFYGTMVSLLRLFDDTELADAAVFASKFSKEPGSWSPAVKSEYVLMTAKALQDPVPSPISDEAVRNLVVDATVSAVRLTGSASLELLLPLVGFEF